MCVRVSKEFRDSVRSPRAGATGGCEASNMLARNQTPSLILSSEPFIQPLVRVSHDLRTWAVVSLYYKQTNKNSRGTTTTKKKGSWWLQKPICSTDSELTKLATVTVPWPCHLSKQGVSDKQLCVSCCLVILAGHSGFNAIGLIFWGFPVSLFTDCSHWAAISCPRPIEFQTSCTPRNSA